MQTICPYSFIGDQYLHFWVFECYADIQLMSFECLPKAIIMHAKLFSFLWLLTLVAVLAIALFESYSYQATGLSLRPA